MCALLNKGKSSTTTAGWEAEIRAEGPGATGGVCTGKIIFSDNCVTHPHRSWPSIAMFGWQDLSPRSRSNAEPLRSTRPKTERDSSRTGLWNATLGQCGETQKGTVHTNSEQGRSKLQRCQRRLLTVQVRLPGPLEAHRHRLSLGSKILGFCINKSPLCFRKLKCISGACYQTDLD